VIDSTDTHYNLELLARFKRVTVEKSVVDTVGDKQGILQQDNGARGMSLLGSGGPTTSLFAYPGQHPEVSIVDFSYSIHFQLLFYTLSLYVMHYVTVFIFIAF